MRGWRSFFTLVVLFYAYGHPSLDGYRPMVLNEPFHEFHGEIGSTVRNYWTRVTDTLMPHFENAYAQVSPVVASSRAKVQQAFR
jgi:hypothetical protein